MSSKKKKDSANAAATRNVSPAREIENWDDAANGNAANNGNMINPVPGTSGMAGNGFGAAPQGTNVELLQMIKNLATEVKSLKRKRDDVPRHDVSSSEESFSGFEDSESDEPDVLDETDLERAILPSGQPQSDTGPVDKNDINFDKAMDEMKRFFDVEEPLGEAVNDSLANILNGSLRRRPNDEFVAKTCAKYLVPQNLQALKVPKTNPMVWDKMRKGSKVVDANLQKIQLFLAKAVVPIVEVVTTKLAAIRLVWQKLTWAA